MPLAYRSTQKMLLDEQPSCPRASHGNGIYPSCRPQRMKKTKPFGQAPRLIVIAMVSQQLNNVRSSERAKSSGWILLSFQNYDYYAEGLRRSLRPSIVDAGTKILLAYVTLDYVTA